MGSLAIARHTLTAPVANGGTVVVPYPTGTTQADLTDTTGGSVAINENDVYPQGNGAGTVAFAFGATDVTITNNSGVTWHTGSHLTAGFGSNTINGSYNLTNPRKIQDKVNAL